MRNKFGILSVSPILDIGLNEMWQRNDIMLWLTQLITCDEECRLRQVLHCPHPTYNPHIGYSTQIVLMRQCLLKHRRPSFLRHSTICRTTRYFNWRKKPQTIWRIKYIHSSNKEVIFFVNVKQFVTIDTLICQYLMLCISLLTVHFPHNHLLKDIIYHTGTGLITGYC